MLSCQCLDWGTIEVDQEVGDGTPRQLINFLNSDKYEVLSASPEVHKFHITPTLIEGTTNEFSNKLSSANQPEKTTIKRMLNMLNQDSSYDWEDSFTNGFIPHTQFVLTKGTQRLIILMNEDYSVLSFINLEGQQLIRTTERFRKFMKNS